MPTLPRPTVPHPLSGPDFCAVAAAALLAALELQRLPAVWTAYRTLARYASGGPGDEVRAVLHAALPAPPEAAVAPLVFVALLVFLAEWVLRARRNAAVLRPDHAFRYSPAGAVAGVLAPVANLWCAGRVVAELAEAACAPGERPRRWPVRAAWATGVVAVLAGVAAGAVGSWTTLGSPAAGERLPTTAEVGAQLALAVLESVRAVSIAALAVSLAVVVASVGRGQARLASLPPAVPEVERSAVRPALARAAVAVAAVAAALGFAMTVAHASDEVGFDGNLVFSDTLTGFGMLLVSAVLAVHLVQALALVVVAVRFTRWPARTAVSAVAALMGLAWVRLLIGPSRLLVGSSPDLRSMNLLAALACVAAAVLVVLAVRPAAVAGRGPGRARSLP